MAAGRTLISLNEWPSIEHPFALPVRYLRRDHPGARGVVVCLHGYQDHALSMVRRLGWADREDLRFTLLAVNAPFPVPIRTADKFTEAYAWYFREATRGIAVGSPGDAAGAIASILEKENLLGTPGVICAFSQGGLVAPALAARWPGARAIVGVGTGYPAEAYASPRAPEVCAVHGEADETWPIDDARRAHDALITAGRAGTFTAVANLGHRLSPAVGDLVRDIVGRYLV